jgi:hypothetical protein
MRVLANCSLYSHGGTGHLFVLKGSQASEHLTSNLHFRFVEPS